MARKSRGEHVWKQVWDWTNGTGVNRRQRLTVAQQTELLGRLAEPTDQLAREFGVAESYVKFLRTGRGLTRLRAALRRQKESSGGA